MGVCCPVWYVCWVVRNFTKQKALVQVLNAVLSCVQLRKTIWVGMFNNLLVWWGCFVIVDVDVDVNTCCSCCCAVVVDVLVVFAVTVVHVIGVVSVALGNIRFILLPFQKGFL